MFDVSWGKLVIIGVVALLVIGPKELPTVLRTVGQWMGKIRRMAAEFQGQFQDAMREAEMADLKKQFDDTTSDLQSAFDPTKVTSDVEKLVGDPLNPQNDFGAASTTATPDDASTSSTASAGAIVPDTAPPAPDISVPMPDLPPPPETKDFAGTATPAAPASTVTEPSAPDAKPASEASGGKAA